MSRDLKLSPTCSSQGSSVAECSISRNDEAIQIDTSTNEKQRADIGETPSAFLDIRETPLELYGSNLSSINNTSSPRNGTGNLVRERPSPLGCEA